MHIVSHQRSVSDLKKSRKQLDVSDSDNPSCPFTNHGLWLSLIMVSHYLLQHGECFQRGAAVFLCEGLWWTSTPVCGQILWINAATSSWGDVRDESWGFPVNRQKLCLRSVSLNKTQRVCPRGLINMMDVFPSSLNSFFSFYASNPDWNHFQTWLRAAFLKLDSCVFFHANI